MIIFRFTVKIGANVETHYVRANTIERASKELSLHLNVPESTLRHNPKNIPFKVREKILKRVTEVIDGKEVTFKLTLDIKDTDDQATRENTQDSVNRIDVRERVLDSHRIRQSTFNESKVISASKMFDTGQTLYNTYRYDIEHLFKEDEEIIRKYAGDTNISDRSDIIDNTIRQRTYARLRALLIRDGHQDKPYKNTNNAQDDPVTLLEVLDAYFTNFSKPL